MLTTVHTKKMAIDLWTGEAFDASLVFRYPVRGKMGSFEWKGCFSCPSNALAAMAVAIEGQPQLHKDQKDELYSLFQVSLRRDEEELKEKKMTLAKSPMFSELVEYGGSVTLEEFHTRIDWTLQRTLFSQVLPDPPSKSSPPKSVSNTTVTWNTIYIPSDSRASTVSGKNTVVPRGMARFIEFLSEMRRGGETPQAAVVYWNEKKDTFAIGEPKEWKKRTKNTRATKLMLGQKVVGSVSAFRRTEIVIEEEKKKRERPPNGPHPPPAKKAKRDPPPPPPIGDYIPALANQDAPMTLEELVS